MSARTLAATLIAIGCISLAPGPPANAQLPSPAPLPTPNPTVVTTRATGTFEVKLNPLAPYETAEAALLGRLSIDKQFHGDLEGTSRGEMLTAGSSVKGSAGYVAIEHVTGTLQGRSGRFSLQHFGTMTRGAPHLVISIVPDSGTGQLEGIAGTMQIDISGGKHSYTLEYTLPGAP